MDKTEYRMKLDEMNRLVDTQDYEGALAIADSIDWKRVKSVRTLCMVADIYEVNGELDESMRILQLAYKRSSLGKMILYRQVELSLKMGDYDQAVKYYNQYLETASNDTSKYILKYKIYKAQNAPLDEQISILEEYKDREYTERWVYELARLYKKAGKQDKCVETCDDLILWFGEGKYVTKAMELKMSYVPLNPSQKAKYEKREKDSASVAGISAAAMAGLQKASASQKPEPAESFAKPMETPEAGMEEAAATAEPETSTGESQPEIPVKVDTEQLQERLAKSFQEVLSGFNRTKVTNAFEALGRVTNSEVPQMEKEENIEEYQVTDLEPETVNEGKISAEKGEAIIQKTEIPETPAAEEEIKPEDKEITSVDELDLEALFAETSGIFAEEAGGGQIEPEIMEIPENPVEEPAEVLEAEKEEEPAMNFDDMPEIRIIDPEEALEIRETTKAEESGELTPEVEPEEVWTTEAEQMETETESEEVSAKPSLGDTQEFNLEEQLMAALGESTGKTEPETEAAEEELIIEESDIEEQDTEEPELVEIADFEEAQETVEEKSQEPSGEAGDFLPEIDMDLVMELQKEKETQEAEDAEIDHVAAMLEEAEIPAETTASAPEKETPEEKRMRIMNNTRPERLTDQQKNVFSYFAKVPGMDEQILDAIHGVYQHADEKTSHRGNIAIMGSHGTGKTRLSEGLVKAICKELGLEAVKFANLDASDMNRKNPASVIGKMAGGFLLIERASYMNAETIKNLSKAMDFRTDSMILLIEDDKANMRKMLADYPEFAEKFETVISIPVFTNDELVTFARTYAKENGYRMDEMGVLALYTLIGDNQREDEPITIGKVKEMVDGAIRKAGGMRLGKRISKRHTDGDGRILLYEKDFDL
ncbi:MAG: hypothetical protein KH828_02910 [Clostridiales bacterium]|nr:hypothetical protein [Clostridiales bacterium]